MNIGVASKASGVTAKMIRYYESIGVIPEPDRRESGYRDYSPDDVRRLTFVRRARELGFSMEDIGELLSLWGDRDRSRTEVREIAMRHVGELEQQRVRLQEMIETLRGLVDCCKKGNRPECPIMAELDAGKPASI
jgi:MerR family gold-responsive transcriptional activator of gol and ges genes